MISYSSILTHSCVLALALTVLPAASPAGDPVFPAVIHVWVDPHYGSDSGASANNPNGSLQCGISPSHPHDVSDPNQGGVPLLHASWPFKTVTAAVGYISTALPLPNTSPISGHVWEHAIIHLLPGRYSRSTTPEPNNGLSGNGETFPIVLPNRVSVQGTSALNTLIDLERVGAAFQFGLTSADTGVDSVIDSVAIYNALRRDQAKEPKDSAIAIRIGPAFSSEPTITNCFIYGNEVGIALDADPGASPPIVHKPVIVNNTIAWNLAGIWSGDVSVTPPAATVGVSTPTIINNIFDATPDPTSPCPIPWTRLGNSAFEAIALADMTVTTPAPNAGDNGNYNAFEPPSGTKYNLGTAFIPGFPATALRAGAVTPTVQPSRDISPYTGGTSGIRRGVLYVRDLLCNGPFSPSASFDRSPHDFRLSPGVALAATTPVPPGNTALGATFGSPNPLVNNGLFYDFLSPLVMANGNTHANRPGTLAGDADWPYHSWDEDCEGFGNPRVVDHRRYPNLGQAPAGEPFIDIGADEVGHLIVAGFRFGTTMFVELLGLNNPCNPGFPSSPLTMNNKFLWYLGPPTTYPSLPPPQKVPTNTARAKFLVISASNQIPGYTFRPWMDRWTFKPGGRFGYYFPALTDITPHLVPDTHPWWVFLIPLSPTNPIWQPCNPNYNQFLYQNPAAGVANPPGTHSVVKTGRFRWLDGLPASPTYQPFPTPSLGGPLTYTTFDNWCRANDTSMPPRVMETFLPTGTTSAGAQQCFCQTSDSSLNAFRYSIEVETTSTWGPAGSLLNSNAQSFMVMVECSGK